MSDFHLIAPRLPGAQGAISAAAVTATVPDPPRNFTALDNGTILRGTVQGRDKEGLIAVSTDQGILKIATNANLPAGSNVTLEVRSVGDRLQVVILAVDLGTAPAPTAAATDQSGTQGAAGPGVSEAGRGTGAAAAADHAGRTAGTAAPAPANQPTVVVAGTRLTAIVIQSVPRDLIQSAAPSLAEPDLLAKPSQAAPLSNATAAAAATRSASTPDFRPPAPPPIQASLIPGIHDRIAALFADTPDTSDRVPDAALLNADKAAARAASAIAPQVGTLISGAMASGPLTLNAEMRQRIIELFVGASAEAPDVPLPDIGPSSASAARSPSLSPAAEAAPPSGTTAAPLGSISGSSPVTAAAQPQPGTAPTAQAAPPSSNQPPSPPQITAPSTAPASTPASTPQAPLQQLPAAQAAPPQQAGSPQAGGQPLAASSGSPPPAPQAPALAGEIPAPPQAPGVTPAPAPAAAAPSPGSTSAAAPLPAEAASGGQPPVAGPTAGAPQPANPVPPPAANYPPGSPALPNAPDLPGAPLPPAGDATAAPVPAGTNAGPGGSGAVLPLLPSNLPPSLAAALAAAGDDPTTIPSAPLTALPPAIAGLVPQDPTVPTIPIAPPVIPTPVTPPVTPAASANTATASDGKASTTAQPQGNAAGGAAATGAAPAPDNESTARTAPIPLTAVVADASKLPLAGTPSASIPSTGGATATGTPVAGTPVAGEAPATGGAAAVSGAASANGAPPAANLAAAGGQAPAGQAPAGGATIIGNAALPSGATLADAQAEYQTLNTLGSTIGFSEAGGTELPGGPLPTGTELRLRVLNIQQQGVITGNPIANAQAAAAAASAGGKATIVGQILGHTPAGHPVIHSPVGDLVLQQQASLPVGASITLAIEAMEMANAGALGMPATPQMTALNLAQGWPTLLDLMLTLQHGPGAAAQPGGDTDPAGIARLAQPGSKLAADLNAAMDAFRSGDFEKLFGPLAAALKTSGGKQDGVRKLRDEFNQLSMLAQDRPQQDWRSFFLPIWDDGRLQQINLFYRRQRRNQGEKDKGEDATRFVVEVNFTRLGNCQLDGLIRKKHFDLMVRSHQELPLNVKRDLSGLFAEARELGNYAGDISFQTTARFPVVPLDDVVRDAPSVTA